MLKQDIKQNKSSLQFANLKEGLKNNHPKSSLKPKELIAWAFARPAKKGRLQTVTVFDQRTAKPLAQKITGTLKNETAVGVIGNLCPKSTKSPEKQPFSSI